MSETLDDVSFDITEEVQSDEREMVDVSIVVTEGEEIDGAEAEEKVMEYASHYTQYMLYILYSSLKRLQDLKRSLFLYRSRSLIHCLQLQ